jgi:hypothetical protein
MGKSLCSNETSTTLWGLIVDVNRSLQLLLGKSVFSELFNGKPKATAFVLQGTVASGLPFNGR